MLPDALTSVLRGNLVGRRAEWEAVVEEEVTLSPRVENNDPGHLGRPHSHLPDLCSDFYMAT